VPDRLRIQIAPKTKREGAAEKRRGFPKSADILQHEADPVSEPANLFAFTAPSVPEAEAGTLSATRSVTTATPMLSSFDRNHPAASKQFANILLAWRCLTH
jgi:hypothetical protein